MNERTSLISFIQKTISIADVAATNIAGNFEKLNIKKNDLVLKQGRVCDQYIFLEEGCIRSFTFDTEGNEVTTNFFVSKMMVFEVTSFFKRSASQENMQALCDCVGWKISFEKLNYLFHEMHDFREFGRAILVNGFIALKERTLSMIVYTAEQRYEYLLKTKPEIFQHASLKQIASFIGVTDTSLSRIRKEFSKK